MTESAAARLISGFEGVASVIADPLRFKLKLGIGEHAYKTLRMSKAVQAVWDVGGVAASGASVAASSWVAGTFFASKGFLATVGLGAAASTPVGWVVAAAVATGGAYYGVTRLYRDYAGSRVDTIPKFINTPMDVLGARLFDLMGSLAVRVAQIDGEFADAERDEIIRYFVSEWGFDASYARQALNVIVAGSGHQKLKEIAQTLAAFQAENPDCNPAAMRSELIEFLRELAEADGDLDEREELAIERVERILSAKREYSLKRSGRFITALGSKAGSVLRRGAAAARSFRR